MIVLFMRRARASCFAIDGAKSFGRRLLIVLFIVRGPLSRATT